MKNQHAPIKLNEEQRGVLAQLLAFVDPDSGDDAFVLSGAAGTGKTSLMKHLVDKLEEDGVPVFLAAPTARAAHILGQKTGFPVRTIHSMIYDVHTEKDKYGVILSHKVNTQTDFSVYIVDEASMVGDTDRSAEKGLFRAPGALLSDLLRYVGSASGGSRLILLGDKYQLAPVGEESSPALDPDYLTQRHSLKTRMAELTQVMRQAKGSGLLDLAQGLRNRMDGKSGVPAAARNGLVKMRNVFGALERFAGYYEPDSDDKAMFIARSNKRVNWLNNWTRKQLGFAEDGNLVPGERVVLESTWMSDERVIYKGDSGVIVDIDQKVESYADLHFVDARISFKDSQGAPFIEAGKVLLEVLRSENGNLSFEQEKFLHHQVHKHNRVYRDNPRPTNDKYIGAFRLRHGYALTCNKAQGGEWDEVMLDPYYPKDYRWLYTAVTRARETLYSWPAYRGKAA